MSALRAGASSPVLSLLHLPRDVLLQILARLTPFELAALAQVCSRANQIVSDAHIWRLAAHRHLNDRAVRPTSAAALFSLAERLVCRWWLLTGAFVAGMPVHRRKGFVDVRARGGRELAIHPNGTTTCYVMGDPHLDALLWPQPAVHLSFFIDANGPYPIDGMTARLIHAVENPKPLHQSPPTSPEHSAHQLQSSPPLSDSQTPPFPHSPESQTAPPYLSLNGVPPPVSIAQQRAPVRVTISINNHVILKHFRPETPHFSVLDLSIPQELLYTKPRANVLSVELNKYPNEAYWLKEVSIMPSFLPAPVVDKASLIFARNLSDRPAPKPAEHVGRASQIHTATAALPLRPVLSSPPRSRRPPSRQVSHVHTAPRSPRSPVRERDSQRRLARSQSSRNKRAKHQPHSKSSRHMYHHNNYRSPRGSSHHAPKN